MRQKGIVEKKSNREEENGAILLASLGLCSSAYLVLVVMELIAVARLEHFETVRA